MGISANQARLMMLTARQHDLELRAQSISATKMVTTMQSQTEATNYSEGLNNYSILKQAMGSLSTASSVYYKVDDKGNITTSTKDATGAVAGNALLATLVSKLKLSDGYNVASSCATPEAYLTAVKGKYDTSVAKVSSEEKLLDMELTQLNTEHNAIKTEYDSIKSLVKDNTEKSFNVFG